MSEAEIPLCLAFNRINHRRLLSRTFGTVSRLGDGVFWYVLMLMLPFIHGIEALPVSLHMGLVGLLSLPVYKWLKTTTLRDRPLHLNGDIFRSVAPLDQFSFPSGHTMHAVGFSIVLLAYYPQWAWIVVPFASLVAMSRLVLGLHYPSDVLAGALIGTLVAVTSLLVAF
ncbi:MAG: phosphatase PAP2 family protein [Chromatiales bacterium]|nr:phosphatase PAP2 family protein [Chromatiales bacterium]MDX9767079.1 phosphatase PAP2 family protein [Ectothiorhodospiraceae bacterium]